MRLLARSLLLYAAALLALTSGVDTRQLPTLLLTSSHVTYEGAFRLPDGGTDQTTFKYGADVLAYDPYRNSIWGVGHDHHQRIAEINIPVPVNGALGALPRATFRTPFFDTGPLRAVGLGGTIKIGGILPQPNGDLIVGSYAYYDSGGAQVLSHFRRSISGAVTGPFTFNTSSSTVAPGRAGSISGYMGPIPSEWQASFGGTAFAGNCCLSIISRTSLGPALSVFTPSQVGSVNPVPVQEVLGYPITHPTLGPTTGSWAAGDLFNGSASNGFHGMFFVPNTRTVLSLQRIGTGVVNYNAGYTAPPYIWSMLAYDINDLLAVKAGSRTAWSVVPYAHWTLPIPLGSVAIESGNDGVTYDPATGRIFATIHTGQSGGEHIVLVYRVNVTPPLPPTPDTTPPTVSLSASSLTFQVGGTSTLTATATDNVGVTSVDFLVNGGVVSTDASAPYTFGWTPGSAGSYTLRAHARDAANNVGQSSILTATVTAVPPPPVDVTPPVVSNLTATPQTFTLGASTVVAVAASDNVGVTSVVFSINGTPIATDVSSPYSAVWTPGADGTFTLQATARDAAGNSTVSASVSITVNPIAAPPPVDCVVSAWSEWSAWVPVSATTEERTRTRDVITPAANGGAECPHLFEVESRPIVTPPPADTTAPLVSLAAVSNAIVGTPITLSASATDAVGVVGVLFTANGVTILDDLAPPYTTPWTPSAAGTVSLLATARDAAGNLGLSNVIAVAVTDPSVPPGQGPPISAIFTTSKCRITVEQFSGTPDGNPGWKLQLQLNGQNFGSADITDPYASPNRTREVGLGTYLLTAKWTKSGQADVIQTVGTFVCAP